MRARAARTEDQRRHSEIVLIQEPITRILRACQRRGFPCDVLKGTCQTSCEFVIDWQLVTHQRRIEKRFPLRLIGLEERISFTERTTSTSHFSDYRAYIFVLQELKIDN